MKSENRTICLTETEFKLVSGIYGITTLMCFDMNSETDASVMDTFSLFKKGYISNDTGEFEVSDEIAELFSALAACKKSAIIESDDYEIPNYYMCFSEYPYVVFMEPGSRATEYIKLRSIALDNLSEELQNIGVLRSTNIDESFNISIDPDAPIVKELMEIRIIDSNKGTEIGSVSVVRQGVGERIKTVCDGEEELIPYSADKIISEMMRIIEKDDIG